MANKLINVNSVNGSDRLLMNDGRFKQLSSPDLNNIKFTFISYVTSSTNYPSGYNGNGELISIFHQEELYGYQIYKPYNSSLIFMRNYNENWTDWRRIATSFIQGDIFTLSGNYVIASGFVTSSKRNLVFSLPIGGILSSEAIGKAVTFNSLKITARATNGVYIMDNGTSDVELVNNENYSIYGITTNASNVRVTVTRNSDFNCDNNTPVSITISAGTSFTFS